MVLVNDVFSYLNTLAPVRYQMDFDNSGFLVGEGNREVRHILVTLDITEDVITQAQTIGADLIVSHHPLVFHKLSSVRADDLTGSKIIRLIRSGISAICMHTNLDIAPGGVNDALMEVLNAEVTGILEPDGTDDEGNVIGCGRIGTLSEALPLDAFLSFVTERLHVSGLRYVSGGKPVHHIAVCGGSGGNMLELAVAAGCDTFVTADVKYDRFLAAREFGINLIDADHFCTENVVVPKLAEQLRARFSDVQVSVSRLKQTASFYAAP